MDIKKLEGIDVVGDARNLPFEDNLLDEIYGHWVLEHFAYRDIPDLLLEWKRALKKGGMVHMVTNNGAAHLKAYHDKVINIHELNRMIFGIDLTNKNVHTGIEDLHKTFWTEELAKYFFRPVFREVEILEQWKHREDDGSMKCPAIIIKAWK